MHQDSGGHYRGDCHEPDHPPVPWMQALSPSSVGGGEPGVKGANGRVSAEGETWLGSVRALRKEDGQQACNTRICGAIYMLA